MWYQLILLHHNVLVTFEFPAYFVHFSGNFHICDLIYVACQATRESVSQVSDIFPLWQVGVRRDRTVPKSWRNEGPSHLHMKYMKKVSGFGYRELLRCMVLWMSGK